MSNALVFPLAVRMLREESELTQDDLAEQAGVSRATVANVELLRHPASPRTRRRLARVFGFRPSEIEYGASVLFGLTD